MKGYADSWLDKPFVLRDVKAFSFYIAAAFFLFSVMVALLFYLSIHDQNYNQKIDEIIEYIKDNQ